MIAPCLTRALEIGPVILVVKRDAEPLPGADRYLEVEVGGSVHRLGNTRRAPGRSYVPPAGAKVERSLTPASRGSAPMLSSQGAS